MYSQTHVLIKQSCHIYIKNPQPEVMDFPYQFVVSKNPTYNNQSLVTKIWGRIWILNNLVRFGHKYSFPPF